VATRTERDFVHSLERGLAVLQVFSPEHPSVTLSQAATLTGLTRATARRILLTLEQLGYVRAEGRHFVPTPRVLGIGYAYLSSMDQWQAGTEVVYVARVPSTRVMSVNLNVGARVPAYATSMGRVLLGGLHPAMLDQYFAGVRLLPLTPHTVTDEARLRERIAEAREQGWSLVDEELEDGLRSIAAPIYDRYGRLDAALTICGHAGRVTSAQLRDEFLPHLLIAAKQITDQVRRS
jgi:IclR family transcriptional regulator, pca regulon regulatory protein